MGEDGDIANMLVMGIIFTFAQGLGGYLLDRLMKPSAPEANSRGDEKDEKEDHTAEEIKEVLGGIQESLDKISKSLDRNLKLIARSLPEKPKGA